VVPEERRAWRIAQEHLAAALGEPVETALHMISPSRRLPSLLDEWLDETEPDLVFLKVNWYWYAYESVPRRIERILGRAGRPVARAGVKATHNEKLAHNPAFKLGRRTAHRLIGGDPPYSTVEVLDVMETVIRRVVAMESIALVVKGNGGSRTQAGDGFMGPYERFNRRRIEVEGSVERLCKSLNVPYIGTPARSERSAREARKNDGIHRGAFGHERMGHQEGMAMVAAWRAFHGSTAMKSQPERRRPGT
jgi:hypothetical protein